MLNTSEVLGDEKTESLYTLSCCSKSLVIP